VNKEFADSIKAQRQQEREQRQWRDRSGRGVLPTEKKYVVQKETLPEKPNKQEDEDKPKI